MCIHFVVNHTIACLPLTLFQLKKKKKKLAGGDKELQYLYLVGVEWVNVFVI